MKSVILVLSLALLSVATESKECLKATAIVDEGSRADSKIDALGAVADKQFRESFKLLVQAMSINSFKKERPGFKKLLSEQSEKLFEDSIAVAKHLALRGHSFEQREPLKSTNETPFVLELTEDRVMKSVEKTYKDLMTDLFTISNVSKDPEIDHFIKEKLLSKYASSVREFAGHYNNLIGFLPDEFKLGVYLYDQHLQ